MIVLFALHQYVVLVSLLEAGLYRDYIEIVSFAELVQQRFG